MKSKYILIIAVIALLVALPFIATYYSLDSQIQREGFKVEQTWDSIWYWGGVRAYNMTDVTELNQLENLAKNYNVTTIYSNQNHLTNWEGYQTYYFLSDGTVYYYQFKFVEDQPYSIQNLWLVPFITGAGLVIAVVFTAYIYKTQNSTQQQSRGEKCE